MTAVCLQDVNPITAQHIAEHSMAVKQWAVVGAESEILVQHEADGLAALSLQPVACTLAASAASSPPVLKLPPASADASAVTVRAQPSVIFAELYWACCDLACCPGGRLA